MAKLISDFFCVAQSGSTIDGREIKPSWLLDSAKDYNADFYAARIWFEHIRYFGAMGDVFAVKAEQDEKTGIVRLFNRIIPSPELIELKRNNRALYSSIEISPKLENTGRAYQRGLGVTDSPASFATDRVEFAIKHLEQDTLFTASIEVDDVEFTTERSIFDFMRRGSKNTPEQPQKPDQFTQENDPHTEDDIDMDKAEFNEAFDSKMAELLEAQKAQFTEQFESSLKPLQEKLEQQETQLNEFKEQQQEIIELAKQPGGKKPEGDRDEHTGGSDDEPQFSC